jgi:hypothetical protein
MHRILISAVAAVLLAIPLGAQQLPNRSWALSAGAMGYDASGTGTAPVVAVSATQTLPWRWVALEGAVGYAPLSEQFGGKLTQLGVVEAQAQLQWPGRVVRPYVGVGGGYVHYFANASGRKAFEPSAVFATGLRAAMTETWGLRIDARVRGWQFAGATDWAVNTSGEVTAGVSRSF